MRCSASPHATVCLRGERGWWAARPLGGWPSGPALALSVLAGCSTQPPQVDHAAASRRSAPRRTRCSGRPWIRRFPRPTSSGSCRSPITRLTHVPDAGGARAALGCRVAGLRDADVHRTAASDAQGWQAEVHAARPDLHADRLRHRRGRGAAAAVRAVPRSHGRPRDLLLGPVPRSRSHPTGLYDLDFNTAYQPYCYYDVKYDCPIPPPTTAWPCRFGRGRTDAEVMLDA